MSKNIFEELPSRKGTAAEARPQPKGGGERGDGIRASNVEQGANPKEKSEKRIRQAVYDIRYRARREDITLGQALSQYMQNSKLTPQEQAAVKSQLKEEYEVADMIADATAGALYRVFVMNEQGEIDPSQEYIEELKATPERKYHVRVTDKNTGKTYYRYATREKVNQLRANPNIRSVEMLDKMDATYGKAPYEGERKRGEQTARVKAGKGLDPVGKEDKDIDNDGDHDKNDKYLLNRRKKIGAAIATRKEDFIWQEETTSTEGQNAKKITGKGVDNYATGVVKVSPEESSLKKEEYSAGLKRFQSSLQFEAKMTSAEKKEEKKLKRKYDKSGMKASMKKQYGEEGKNIYFATIRKQAMQNAHYEFEDGTLLDEMGMPILGVVKKDDAKKEGPSCETKGSEDPRGMKTKVELVKNKMRAMGLKMSYEPKGEDIQEIPLVVAAPLVAGGLYAAGKGMESLKKKADSAIDKARKTSPIGGDRRVPQSNSYELEGNTISEREFDEPGEEDWRPDVRAHNKKYGGYKPVRKPKPGSGPVKPA